MRIDLKRDLYSKNSLDQNHVSHKSGADSSFSNYPYNKSPSQHRFHKDTSTIYCTQYIFNSHQPLLSGNKSNTPFN